MPKPTDPVLLALLAVLEQRALAKGGKSIVKRVVGRLADTGADPKLLSEIAALRVKKTAAAKSADKVKTPGKAMAKVVDVQPAGIAAPAVTD